MNNTFLIFIGVFLLLIILFGFHIYFRFINKLNMPIFYAYILKAIFLYSLFSILLYPIQKILDFSHNLNVLIYYGMGSFFLLIFLSLFYELFQSPIKIVKFDEDRRRALSSFLDVTFIIIGFLYFFRAFAYSLKQPTINTTKIPLGLDDFKILQISDLHIGEIIKKEYVKKMVSRINALKPDLIVLTGDIIDAPLSKIKEDLEPLNNLRAKHGIYMSLGNHEYYQGNMEQWIGYFKNTNIKLLINENTIIDNKFNLIGIADRAGYRMNYYKPDLKKSFFGIDKTKPSIVMSHQPIMIEEIEKYKPELILSGHTHGGQIFPFGFLVKLAQKYLNGLYQHNKNTKIFVSKGAGYWGPPIRVLADNEVNLLVV